MVPQQRAEREEGVRKQALPCCMASLTGLVFAFFIGLDSSWAELHRFE